MIDLAAVPLLDATAANALEALARKAVKHEVRVLLTGTNHEVRQELFVHGVKPPLVRYERSIETALAKLHRPVRLDAPAPLLEARATKAGDADASPARNET